MNLFAALPAQLPDELVTVLAESQHVRIERIVSLGHVSPPGFWFDQDQDEFVVLLLGSARLRFDDDEQTLEMKPGDFLHIPAHRRHRVEWTAPDEPTVWLAVRF